jgi:hypothetical protein
MKTLKLVIALLAISSLSFGQLIIPTQYNPWVQTPNQFSGNQSWTALGPMYNDFISLNNAVAGIGANNNMTGNNTFVGTTTFSGVITGLKATTYTDSVGTAVALTAAQSGLVVSMAFLSGDTIILPPSSSTALGTRFEIDIRYSTTSVGHTIKTNGTDVFYGTLFEMSTTTVSPFLSTANKTIHMSSTTSCGLAGGRVILMLIPGGRWQISGNLYGSGTVVTAFAN